jgi:hypothetical protein
MVRVYGRRKGESKGKEKSKPAQCGQTYRLRSFGRTLRVLRMRGWLCVYMVGGMWQRQPTQTEVCATKPERRTDLKVSRDKFKRKLDLVDALYAVDAIDATYVGENGFELALVGYFQAGFDASVLAVGAAFESANV